MPMKKILTSFALLCFFTTLYAQDCAFQFQGRELADGSEVTIFAREDPLFGDLVCDTNPSDDAENGLFLVNKTSSAISCSATINIQTNTMNGSEIQWCMGMDCMAVNSTSLSKNFTLPASSKMITKFDCLPTKEGEMVTKLSVRAASKTYTVTIRFVNAPTHVSDASITAVPVAYYTLDGRQVPERPRGVCLVKFSDGRVRKLVSK